MKFETYTGPVTSNRKGRAPSAKGKAIREALAARTWVVLPEDTTLGSVRAIAGQMGLGVRSGHNPEGRTVFMGSDVRPKGQSAPTATVEPKEEPKAEEPKAKPAAKAPRKVGVRKSTVAKA